MGKLLDLHIKKLEESPVGTPTEQWFIANTGYAEDIKNLISRHVAVQAIYRILKSDDIGFPYGQTAFRRWVEALNG